MDNTITTVLAITIPNIVAILSLLFQYLISRNNSKNERLKIFYTDRLSAFKELNSQISNIVQSIEFVLSFKKAMLGKMTFRVIVENSNNGIPKEIHEQFMNNLYQGTVLGKTVFLKCVENNKLFFTDEIEVIITKLKTEYFDDFPDILLPETADGFIEQKLPIIREISRAMVSECRKVMMVNK